MILYIKMVLKSTQIFHTFTTTRRTICYALLSLYGPKPYWAAFSHFYKINALRLYNTYKPIKLSYFLIIDTWIDIFWPIELLFKTLYDKHKSHNFWEPLIKRDFFSVMRPSINVLLLEMFHGLWLIGTFVAQQIVS